MDTIYNNDPLLIIFLAMSLILNFLLFRAALINNMKYGKIEKILKDITKMGDKYKNLFD